MAVENLTDIIEAVLFASGRSVPIADLAEKLGATENAVRKSLEELKARYPKERGIQLLDFNKKAQFASNPAYKEGIEAVLNPIRAKELTRTILECAAIIAYKQPITRTEIDLLRGVNSDYGVNALLELHLIYPMGKKDAVGHPTLFGTTDEFLKRFKLHSLDELPDYDELMAKIAQPDEERDAYLYSREEYTEEPELPAQEPEKKNRPQSKEEVVEGGYEIPDFLSGIDESDIVKIS